MPTDYTGGLPQGNTATPQTTSHYILPPKSKHDDLIGVVYQLEFSYGHHSQRSLFATNPLNIRAIVTSLLGQFYGTGDTTDELDTIIFFLGQIAKHKECENWDDFFIRVKSYLTT